MKHLLEKILVGETFTEQEAYSFIYAIEEESLSPESISGILIGIQIRGLNIDEPKGFRTALLELSMQPDLDGNDAIDLCGTGGDGKNTFNISTTSAFILAAMGKKVIKHGNYGVSSLCGSSNVLEELGLKFSSDRDELQRNLDERNICFLHAPLFHPTMKKVAPIRKSLGVRTIFNCLGPLVNPVQPKYQLTGTYSLELARIYQHILKDKRKDFRVVYGMDGYDEITLTDTTRILGKHTDGVISSQTFGKDALKQEALFAGGSKKDAAILLNNILKGQGTTAQNAVVAANVATALQIYEPQTSLQHHFETALDFIQSGAAQQTFKFN